jgi:8-oxo-dGTP pyrophosphatase MutT (NUDIX family)
MNQKWRTLRSKSILRDSWIDLRADDCVTPAGTAIGPYYVVTYPDWVNVVALTPEDHLVLVRQYRHAVGEVLDELPGGAVDPSDADLEHAARRELEEETGFTAPCWRFIGSLYPNPASQTNRVHTYLALDAVCDRGQRLDAGEEGLQVLTVPVDDVTVGLSNGRLSHAMQAAAIFMALAAIGRVPKAQGR